MSIIDQILKDSPHSKELFVYAAHAIAQFTKYPEKINLISDMHNKEVHVIDFSHLPKLNDSQLDAVVGTLNLSLVTSLFITKDDISSERFGYTAENGKLKLLKPELTPIQGIVNEETMNEVSAQIISALGAWKNTGMFSQNREELVCHSYKNDNLELVKNVAQYIADITNNIATFHNNYPPEIHILKINNEYKICAFKSEINKLRGLEKEYSSRINDPFS